MSATSRALSLSNSSAKKLARKSPSRVAQAKRRQQRSMLFESLEDRHMMAGNLYANAVLADGPLAYWQFNEGSGTAPQDSTGNMNHGVFAGAGAAPAYVAGQSGTPGDLSLNFTPTGFVNVPSATTAFDSIVTRDAVTVEFWHFGDPLTNPRTNTTFNLTNGSSNRVAFTHTPWSDGRIYWDAGIDANAPSRTNTGVLSSANYEGQWNHMGVTRIPRY